MLANEQCSFTSAAIYLELCSLMVKILLCVLSIINFQAKSEGILNVGGSVIKSVNYFVVKSLCRVCVRSLCVCDLIRIKLHWKKKL